MWKSLDNLGVKPEYTSKPGSQECRHCTLYRLFVEGEDPFAVIRRHPQFQMIKQLVRSNKSLLGPLIQSIGQTNPSLLQVLTAILFSYTIMTVRTGNCRLVYPVEPGEISYMPMFPRCLAKLGQNNYARIPSL